MSPMDIICPNCGSSDYNDNNVCGSCGFFINQLPVGTLLINRYEIKKAIKAGGMGAVYLGYDIYDDRICAVKQMFIYEENAEVNDYITGRFLDEARLLSKLDHPSIPKVTDFFNENTYNYYMIMDYIEGCDLYTYVTEHKGNMPEEKVLKWAIEVCDVLDYLHSRPDPIIHRDLTPANLILSSKNNRLMLVDFGFARPVDRNASMSTSVGTEMYAAPEQCVGYPQTRSDIYSLGATMYFLLTKEQSPLYRPPLIKLRPDVSEHTRWIIEKAMQFAPDERFSSAMDMYQALSECIKSSILPAGNMSDNMVSASQKTSVTGKKLPDRPLSLNKEIPLKTSVMEKKLPERPLTLNKEIPMKTSMLEKKLPDKPLTLNKEIPLKTSMLEKKLPDRPLTLNKEIPLKTSIIEKKLPDRPVLAGKDISLKTSIIEKKLPDKPLSPVREVSSKPSGVGTGFPDKFLSLNKGISGSVPGVEKKQAPRTSLLPKERTLAHIAALKREVPKIEEPPVEDDDDELDDFPDENDKNDEKRKQEKEDRIEDFPDDLANITFIVEKKGIISRLVDVIMKWFGKP